MKRKNLIMLVGGATTLAMAGVANAGGGHHGDWFKKLDTDGNGSISQAELDAAGASHFKKIDANGDGYITAEEIQSARKKRREERAARFLKKKDTDGDGKLSQAEFTAHKGNLMKRADTDGDGEISKAEWDAAKQKMHKRSKSRNK